MNKGIEPQLPWFGADFTRRKLSAPERDFIKVLSAMLDRVRPPQVAPGNTNLTAEGNDCLIAIIPHSLLAGVSIVVWQDLEALSVCWAQIGDLSWHDDLDLGHRVGRFVKKSPVEVWYGEAVLCVEEQLHRPIELEVSRTGGSMEPYVEFFLADAEGERLRLGAGGKRVPLFLRIMTADSHAEHHEVRFTDREPPVLPHPVDIAAWYGNHRESGS